MPSPLAAALNRVRLRCTARTLLVGGGLTLVLLSLAFGGVSLMRRAALPSVPEIHVSPGISGYVGKQIEKARDGLRDKPRDASANIELAMILHANGIDLRAAAQLYERAMLLSPDWRTSYLLGRVRESLGEPERAIAALKQTLGMAERYVPARLALAGVLLERGTTREPERLYAQALQQAQDYAWSHYHYAGLLARQGRLQAAIEHLLRAIALAREEGSEFAAAHHALAHRDRGDEAQASHHLTEFDRLKNRRPAERDSVLRELKKRAFDRFAYPREALVAAKAGRLQEALELIEAGLEVFPEEASLHSAAGEITGAQGKWERARAL